MTDVEMKDESKKPEAKDEKVEEQKEEPQDHFYGKLKLNVAIFLFRVEEESCFDGEGRCGERFQTDRSINQKFEKTQETI